MVNLLGSGIQISSVTQRKILQEREKERLTDRQTERERERTKGVCVYVGDSFEIPVPTQGRPENIYIYIYS